jgi:hypothetical protein
VLAYDACRELRAEPLEPLIGLLQSRIEILDVTSPRRRQKGDASGLTFVRKAFGKGASPIAVAQVKAAR